MFNVTKLLTTIVISFALLGCYNNKSELKINIQNEYDRARAMTKTKGDLCLYLGSVKFPYITEPISPSDIQWDIWNKNKLAKTLPLFTKIGLLKREPIDGKPDLYRYELTELGREYQHTYPKMDIYNNAFCYGIKQLIEVTDVTEKERGGGRGNASVKRTEVTVKFTYHLLEVPEWAISNKEQLAVLYPDFSLNENGESYLGSAILIKKSDGSLYDQGSIGYKVFEPTGKLLNTP